MLSVAVAPESPLGLRLLPEAHAIVGAPLTPVSVAGVARRTTRRTVAVASTTADQPAGRYDSAAVCDCAAAVGHGAAAVSDGTAAARPQLRHRRAGRRLAPGYGGPGAAGRVHASRAGRRGVHKCGADYYRAVFQGNNLVYVTAQP